MAKDARKENVKRVFGSLINNGCAVDGAKFSPWWIGLIMFILGLVLPVLPLFISAAKTEGVTFLGTNEYALGMDKTFGEAINSLDGTLTFDNTSKTISYEANSTYCTSDDSLIGGYVATAGNTNGQYDLRIYYSKGPKDAKEMSAFVTAKEILKYKKGTTTIASVNDEDVYTPSTIYFFETSFVMDVYASNTTNLVARMKSLADLNCFDYDGNDLKAYFVGTSFDKNNRDSRIEAYNKLVELLNVTYKTARNNDMWIGSLIYIGIYAGMNVFMILMIFIMSRGKNNPNNVLNFWHCIKIDWWACLCPGLLGMIIGFIWPSYATMIYVMLIAMRTMWLSMKELRPQY